MSAHLGRRDSRQLSEEACAFASPTYEDLRVESDILAYVVGEGHHHATIFELALRFSPGNERTDAAERAVRELVRARLLSMKQGGVVPGPALAGRSGP